MWAPYALVFEAAVGAILAGLAAAAPACDVIVSQNPAPVRLDYDPFAFSRALGRLTFEVENRAAVACIVDIALLGTDRLAVADVLIGDTGVGVAVTGGTADMQLGPTSKPGIWSVRLDPRKRTRLALDMVVVHDAVVQAGEHLTELTLEVRDNGAPSALSSAVPVKLILVSAPRAQMNIAGAAGDFGTGSPVTTVDFGMLKSNVSRRVFLQVRANSQARLTIDSQNLGHLKIKDGPKSDGGIAYEALLQDKPVDLTGHWERILEPPRTIAGTSIPLDLRLNAIGNHIAGSYSDVLTIELSSI